MNLDQSQRVVAKISVALVVLAAGSVLAWWLSLDHLAAMDRDACRRFGDKAKQLQIEGKTRSVVLLRFGNPSRTYFSDGSEILVYTPGPKWARWNAECKIGIDRRTGLVNGWLINSD
jgi:hypothetical protein